ncbi:MAG: DUF4258 domain-containing protein [Anaerolineae bacterium]|jgi:hypothetical protein|nr:DUF4258 domain-containing protein [Anaerolineae bacterium]
MRNDIIFTDHARERLKLRKISEQMVFTTLKNPERTENEADGDTKFIKTVQKRNVQVIARYLPDQKKWLIVSAWVRGEEDPIPLWKRILLWPWRWLRGRSKTRGTRRDR